MLSKSQARFFFVSTTLGFSLVFLWLTVDTMSQVPKRSHEEQLTDAVAHGKEIWDQNNCMGCHTILGEGGYYAPELTKVYDRRGPEWMRMFLKDPNGMFPGKRRMVQYHFSDEQITELVAYFKWIGQIDTNGFPAKPDLAPPDSSSAASNTSSASTQALANAPAMATTVCVACHSFGGKGGKVGPALDGEGSRRSAEWLDHWLKNPQAIKPGTAMPNLGLSDPNRAELVTWLQSLK